MTTWPLVVVSPLLELLGWKFLPLTNIYSIWLKPCCVEEGAEGVEGAPSLGSRTAWLSPQRNSSGR